MDGMYNTQHGKRRREKEKEKRERERERDGREKRTVEGNVRG